MAAQNKPLPCCAKSIAQHQHHINKKDVNGGGKKLYINYITHEACFDKGWFLIISSKIIECVLKSQVIFWLLAVGFAPALNPKL